MPTTLNDNGAPTDDGRATLVAPGLRGTIDAHQGGTRFPLPEELEQAFRAADVTVADEIEIDAETTRWLPPDAGTRGGSERAVTLTVPGITEGWGQALLVQESDGRIRWITDGRPLGQGGARGGAKAQYEIPLGEQPQPDSGKDGGTERGVIGSIVKKVVKVLVFKLIEEGAGYAANHFAAAWEHKAHPSLLRRYTADGRDAYTVPATASLPPEDLASFDGQTTLLIVHGIMSRSHSGSGFGSLPKDLVAELNQRYDGRILAFDHPTVSVDPTANAAKLLELLAGVRPQFDVLCHSRGGLVTRVLAEHFGLLPGAGAPLDIRGVVMAGTPNNGSTIADPRNVSKLLDTVTNLLDFLPDNPVTDPLSLVLSVVKQVAVGAMGGLDGLTCMAPGSTFLRMLNGAGAGTANYRAIASDFEPAGGSPLSLLAEDLALDALFAREPNDMLVPEVSVYEANGAGTFPIKSPLLLPIARSVRHSGYWRSEDVASSLRDWLPFEPVA
ncbi:MAG: Glutamate synthase large chain [Solirubrobacterales bacterium]|nr:Glutamate synthase large chain [Solirubrobacterales bacterium]